MLMLLLALSGPTTKAHAMTEVIIQPGYNLRKGNSTSAERIRTNRKPQEAMLVRSKGLWRQVCIGGEGTVCEGGQLVWVWHRGVRPAETEAQRNSRSEAGKTECDEKCQRRRNRPIESVETIAEAIGDDPRGYYMPPKFRGACNSFMTERGLGPWGKAMIDAAKRVAPNCMFNRNLFGSICPNYVNLPPAQKNALLALSFGTMGFYESTCRPWASAQGVNDVADGMFQLERTKEARARADRDPRWCRTRENVPTKAAQRKPSPSDDAAMRFQAECTISTIEDTICSKPGSFIFDSAGYWAKLQGNRPITNTIREYARKLRLCVD